jgi:hypothetical protein
MGSSFLCISNLIEFVCTSPALLRVIDAGGALFVSHVANRSGPKTGLYRPGMGKGKPSGAYNEDYWFWAVFNKGKLAY